MAPGQARWAAGAGVRLRVGLGLLAAARLPALSSWLRRCSCSDLRLGASIFFFFFFFLEQKASAAAALFQGRQGLPLLCGGKCPPPRRAPLCGQLGCAGTRAVLPGAAESLFGLSLEGT